MDNKSLDYEEDFEFEDFVPVTASKEETKSDTDNNIIKIENIMTDDSNTINKEETPYDIKSILSMPVKEENKDTNVLEDKYLVVNVDDKPILKEEEKEEVVPSIKQKNDSFKMFVNKYAKLLPVIAFSFVSVLGIYIFINNVKADAIDLIKIEEKSKVGYIDNDGDIVVKPKYLYGTDYHKGFAVVKNYNSLYGILNGKGNVEVQFGNIFSATLYGNRYIVSKFTNEGLKMGLLDSNLDEVTRFKYDNISYSKSGVFLFTRDETMGLMNNDGKEIYTYKVDEIDDRNISIEVSNLDGDSTSDTYAKIKVNDSSTIINTNTGKEVYKYTLDDIKVLDNNVFYIKKSEGNNKYFVIKNDKIVYETSQYLRLRVEDLNSNIAIAIREDANIDYINLLTKKVINSEDSINYTYSNGVVLEEVFNFDLNKNEYLVTTPDKVLGKFSDLKPVDNTYVNGYMKIVTENQKYTFADKKGNVITKREYDYVSDFNKNGYAIVSNDNEYGVLNNKGNEIISSKYDEIIMLDDDLFKNIQKINNQELFIFKDENKYGIINSKGKIVIKAIYNSFEIITTKYPIIKANYNGDDILINLSTFQDLNLDIKDSVEVYDNYIVVSNNYYNYSGQLIYSIGG